MFEIDERKFKKRCIEEVLGKCECKYRKQIVLGEYADCRDYTPVRMHKTKEDER